MSGLGSRITLAAKRLGRGGGSLLAARLGVSVNTVSRWSQERTTPTDDVLGEIATVTGIRLEWLLNGTGSPDFAPDEAFNAAFARGLAKTYGSAMEEPERAYDAGLIAVKAASSQSGGFTIGGTVGQLRRPHGLIGINSAFAIRMPDQSMAERHRQGEPVFIHPHRAATPGDTVLVLTRTSAATPVTAWLRQLVSQTETALTVRQFKPDALSEFPMTKVTAIHRVLSPDDLFAL